MDPAKHREIGIVLVVILLLSTTLIGFAKEVVSTDKASVMEKEGTVEVKMAGGTRWVAAVVNTAISQGDQVRTADNSYCLLSLHDGSTIKMGENTTIEIKNMSTTGSTNTSKIKLFVGKIWNNVNRVTGKKTDFEVESPYTLAAVKGTVFSVDAKADADDLAVFEGEVDVNPVGIPNPQRIGVKKQFMLRMGRQGLLMNPRIYTDKDLSDWHRWNMHVDKNVATFLKNRGKSLQQLSPADRMNLQKIIRKNSTEFFKKMKNAHAPQMDIEKIKQMQKNRTEYLKNHPRKHPMKNYPPGTVPPGGYPPKPPPKPVK